MKFKSNLSVTIILVICSFVQSCSRYSPRLEAALSLAGENRVELEKLSSAAEKEQVLMGLRAKESEICPGEQTAVRPIECLVSTVSGISQCFQKRKG